MGRRRDGENRNKTVLRWGKYERLGYDLGDQRWQER